MKKESYKKNCAIFSATNASSSSFEEAGQEGEDKESLIREGKGKNLFLEIWSS